MHNKFKKNYTNLRINNKYNNNNKYKNYYINITNYLLKFNLLQKFILNNYENFQKTFINEFNVIVSFLLHFLILINTKNYLFQWRNYYNITYIIQNLLKRQQHQQQKIKIQTLINDIYSDNDYTSEKLLKDNTKINNHKNKNYHQLKFKQIKILRIINIKLQFPLIKFKIKKLTIIIIKNYKIFLILY